MGGMPGMGGMSGMGGVGRSDLLGGDAGDINYPYYLINGRIPAAPTTFSAKPGQRIRIRIINAGSDTAFRVALAGHSDDGHPHRRLPVVPTEVDALLIGMGERYDVIVTAGDGVFPLVALAEGKNALARALLSTGAGNRARCRIPARRTQPACRHRRYVHRHTGRRPWDRPNRRQPLGRAVRRNDELRLDDQRAPLSPIPNRSLSPPGSGRR